mmetsp:Transcript_26947/g.41069  ORF Transcript_26947/g.41069 Transcript_26947/m.41069 type:complete len:81 (-) Transcript_26947:961-1203(-)
MLLTLIHKRKQTVENRLRYNFMLLRLQTRVKDVQKDLVRRGKLMETSQKLILKRDIYSEKEKTLNLAMMTGGDLTDKIMV